MGSDILVVEDDQVMIILQQYEGDDNTTREIEELRLGIVVRSTEPDFDATWFQAQRVCMYCIYSTEKER